jgi:UDP-glucose 4-epimerase
MTQLALVTGGVGFIGSHLVEAILEQGYRVRVVDNLSTGNVRNLGRLLSAIEFIRGDLRDDATCRRGVRGADVVFHVAGLPSIARSMNDPWVSHDNNVNATMRLLIACRDANVPRIVYSSSSSVYGDTPALPKVESAELLPCSPYAAAKLAGEQCVLAFARAGLIEGVALRYFNVFGPRQDPGSPYAAAIPLFLRAAYYGVAASVFGDGLQTRDFTYVANVVAANLLAAHAPAERANGTAANVGAGSRTSLIELIRIIERVTERELRYDLGPARPGDVRDSQAGLDRASQILGYTPSVTLEEGLDRTWRWFLETQTPDASEPIRLAAAT